MGVSVSGEYFGAAKNHPDIFLNFFIREKGMHFYLVSATLFHLFLFFFFFGVFFFTRLHSNRYSYQDEFWKITPILLSGTN